ncbi:unnamed protein product, partial [Prorocentrum cordatum]
ILFCSAPVADFAPGVQPSSPRSAPPPPQKKGTGGPPDGLASPGQALNSGLGCPRAPAGGLVVHCGAGAVLRPCSGLAVRRRLAWAAGSPQREARAGRLMRAGRREGGGRGQEEAGRGGGRRSCFSSVQERALRGAVGFHARGHGEAARPPERGRRAKKKRRKEGRQVNSKGGRFCAPCGRLCVFAAVKWYDMGRNPPNHRLTRTSGHRRSGAHSAPRRRGVEVTRGAVSFLPPSLAPTVRGGYREGGREKREHTNGTDRGRARREQRRRGPTRGARPPEMRTETHCSRNKV